MENLEKFEWLLEKRSYSELTEEERQWVKDFVSSEFEYESLRKVNSHLVNYFSDKDKIVPGSEVWTTIKCDIALAKRSPPIAKPSLTEGRLNHARCSCPRRSRCRRCQWIHRRG